MKSEFKKFIHIKSGRIVEAKIEVKSVYEKITLEKIQSEMSEYSELNKMLTNIEIVKKLIADPNYTFLRATSAEEFNNEHRLLDDNSISIHSPKHSLKKLQNLVKNKGEGSLVDSIIEMRRKEEI